MLNRWRQNYVIGSIICHLEPLTEEIWGRGWVEQDGGTVGRTLYSFQEILSKNITRTARSQLDGQHLQFGVYLQTWADLYLLNFLNNKVIIEFGFRRIWRILQFHSQCSLLEVASNRTSWLNGNSDKTVFDRIGQFTLWRLCCHPIGTTVRKCGRPITCMNKQVCFLGRISVYSYSRHLPRIFCLRLNISLSLLQLGKYIKWAFPEYITGFKHPTLYVPRLMPMKVDPN